MFPPFGIIVEFDVRDVCGDKDDSVKKAVWGPGWKKCVARGIADRWSRGRGVVVKLNDGTEVVVGKTKLRKVGDPGASGSGARQEVEGSQGRSRSRSRPPRASADEAVEPEEEEQGGLDLEIDEAVDLDDHDGHEGEENRSRHRKEDDEDTWEKVDHIVSEQRTQPFVSLGCMKEMRRADADIPVEYFFQFFPMKEVEVTCYLIEVYGRLEQPTFSFGRGDFFQWLGLWIKMTIFRLPERREYWSTKYDFGFRRVMSYERFAFILKHFSLPQHDDTGNDPFRWIRRWLDACNERWQNAYEPCSVLVEDETMIRWQGVSEDAHITYMPRKPCPLGIMGKTIVDGATKILLNMELVEGKVADRKKKYVAEFKPTTACAVRLAEPWHGTKRIVIADAWFGSVRTCEELMDVGLYSILNVKQGCAGYPKALMKAELVERDDRVWYKVDVQLREGVVTTYAGGHMDKAPLCVVATCGTSLEGVEAVRYHKHLNKEGHVVRHKYTLAQPKMHAMYRKFSGAVDVFNKVALGPGGIQDVWKTKNLWMRMYGASLAICETNAYFAYMAHGSPATGYDRHAWHEQLSEALINNQWLGARLTQQVGGEEGLTTLDAHGYIKSDGKKLKCVYCGGRTRFACMCGVVVCSPQCQKDSNWVVRKCYAKHLHEVFTGVEEEKYMVRGRES
jgi:hypothetical protein